MKVLVVDPDVDRAPALKLALSASGAEVAVAASGSFALTMLEWNRQDVVISRARIDDMDGHELCAILKSDPGTRDVRFVLVAGADEVSAAQTTAAGVDLVLPPGMAAGALAPLVVGLLQPPAPAPPAPPAPAPSSLPRLRPEAVSTPVAEPPKRYVTPAAAAAAAPWATTSAPGPAKPAAPAAPSTTPPPVSAARAALDLQAMPSGTFQGSLDVMDLADLTQAIAGGGKTGRLILSLARDGGLIAFEAGRVVHAEYRGGVGEAAFGALLTAAHGDGTGRFCFLPSGAGEASCATRTIDKSVDRLLLSIATAIDEKR